MRRESPPWSPKNGNLIRLRRNFFDWLAVENDRRQAKKRHAKGAIAQLGERLLCKQEVGGSIPPGSTKIDERNHQCICFVCSCGFSQQKPKFFKNLGKDVLTSRTLSLYGSPYRLESNVSHLRTSTINPRGSLLMSWLESSRWFFSNTSRGPST